jgi:hypothetical protein
MKNIIKMAFVMGLCLLLVIFIGSCASLTKMAEQPKPVHAYGGEQLPISECAKITGDTIPGHSFKVEEQARIEKVNEIVYRDEQKDPPREIYLKPGTYELEVRYYMPSAGWVVHLVVLRYNKKLIINVKKGENYILHLKPLPKDKEHGPWEFWITDSSGQTVCKSK